MKYFALKAESAGDFGINTKFAKPPSKPPQVQHLHYVLDVWPVDELLGTAGVYIVSESMGKRLQSLTIPVSGVSFEAVEVTTSERFNSWHSDSALSTYEDISLLPRYVWLNVNGKAGIDDFGIDKERLVVSIRVYTAMRMHRLNSCKVVDFD